MRLLLVRRVGRWTCRLPVWSSTPLSISTSVSVDTDEDWPSSSDHSSLLLPVARVVIALRAVSPEEMLYTGVDGGKRTGLEDDDWRKVLVSDDGWFNCSVLASFSVVLTSFLPNGAGAGDLVGTGCCCCLS